MPFKCALIPSTLHKVRAPVRTENMRRRTFGTRRRKLIPALTLTCFAQFPWDHSILLGKYTFVSAVYFISIYTLALQLYKYTNARRASEKKPFTHLLARRLTRTFKLKSLYHSNLHINTHVIWIRLAAACAF